MIKTNDKLRIIALGCLLLYFPYLFIEDIYIIGFITRMFISWGIGSAIAILLMEIKYGR